MNSIRAALELYTPALKVRLMPKWLSESERERIAQFAATPKYERDPEMLAPDDDEEEDE